MDCNIYDSLELNKSESRSIEQINKRIFYRKVENAKEIWQFGSYDIIEVENRLYILQGNGAFLNIYNTQTGKYNQFSIKGLIQMINVDKRQILILTSSRFYQLKMIDGKIKILNQITIVSDFQTITKHQVSKHDDIILWRRDNKLQIIKLGVQNRRKIIFKINIKHAFNLDQFIYHKQKQFLLFFYDSQNIHVLDVFRKVSKNLNFGQLRIIHLKFAENKVYLFYEEWKEGLFLKKIDYPNGNIWEKKFLYNELNEFQILEDNHMLALLTQNYYVKFDKDYKIMKKFQICFNEEVKFLKIYKFFQQGSYMIFFVKEQFKIYQQNDSLNSGGVWIQEVQNYQVELKQLINFDVSQNQQYLALAQKYKLILYQIQEKIEKQYFFNFNTRFLGFSTNCSHLYLTFKNKIICYKLKQHMKITYSQICIDDQHQQRYYLPQQNGLFTLINFNGIRMYKSQQKKQIFRLNHEINMKKKYKFQAFNQTLLISDNKEFFIFRLTDKMLILKVNLDNIDCKLKNEQKLIILSNIGQLLLWDFSDKFVIQQQLIMDNIESIFNWLYGIVIIRTQNIIIVLDQNLNLIEKFETEGDPLLVTQNYIFIQNFQNCDDSAKGFSLIKRK